MVKALILLFSIFSFSFSYEIIDKENIFTIRLKNGDFKTLYIKLKDEVNFNSYTIVNELNLAKTTKGIAEFLKRKPPLKNGKNILICKSSFTLKMIEEDISNITFCPLNLSIYENNETVYISYRKYKDLKKENKIAKEINKNLKRVILNVVKE